MKLYEKISSRHLIRKKAVLKAVLFHIKQGARAMFSLSSVTTNTESGRKARKRVVFKSGDAAMYTLMCQVHLLCEHTRDHLSNVNCYCNFISKLRVTEIRYWPARDITSLSNKWGISVK